MFDPNYDADAVATEFVQRIPTTAARSRSPKFLKAQGIDTSNVAEADLERRALRRSRRRRRRCARASRPWRSCPTGRKPGPAWPPSRVATRPSRRPAPSRPSRSALSRTVTSLLVMPLAAVAVAAEWPVGGPAIKSTDKDKDTLTIGQGRVLRRVPVRGGDGGVVRSRWGRGRGPRPAPGTSMSGRGGVNARRTARLLPTFVGSRRRRRGRR